MIAIARSGNNNLRHPLSYSYARSWRKTGSEPAVFCKIHADSRYPTLFPQTGGGGVRFRQDGSMQDPFLFDSWRGNKFLRATSFPSRIAAGAGAYAQSPSPA